MFLLAVGLLSSCATSKNAANSPVGTWDYMVKDTPYGDIEGQLIISQENGDYLGELRSGMGNTTLDDFSIEGDSFSANARLQGTSLKLAGMIEGDNLKGTIDAGSNGTFPITGSRVN